MCNCLYKPLYLPVTWNLCSIVSLISWYYHGTCVWTVQKLHSAIHTALDVQSMGSDLISKTNTVFIRIVAAATINFALFRAATNRGRLLFEGSYYYHVPVPSTRRERVIIAYVRMCTSAHAHHVTLRYEYN